MAKALNKTFGATLRAATDAEIFPAPLQDRFTAILSERNWLIHRSRFDNRAAYYSDPAALALIQRVDQISANVRELMVEIDRLIDQDAVENGIDLTELNQRTDDILSKWHAA